MDTRHDDILDLAPARESGAALQEPSEISPKEIPDELLVIIPPKGEGGVLSLTLREERTLEFFTRDGAIDPVLEAIRREIDTFPGADVSTEQGRKEIKAFAYRVTQSKTYLENAGKLVAARQKEIPKKIDAARKRLREQLEGWAEEIRKPVVEWEESEKARVEAHTTALWHMNSAGVETANMSSDYLLAVLADIEAFEIGPHLEEFEPDFAAARENAISRLQTAIGEAQKREAEQAELARLRKESADRAEADRLAALQREAEEKARRDQEQRALAEIRAREAAANAEREAIEARAKAEKDAADREIARLQQEAADANRRLAEADERAKREAAEAAAAEERANSERDAARAHRLKINREVVAALIEGGLTEDQAKLVVVMIAKNQVPNVSISY